MLSFSRQSDIRNPSSFVKESHLTGNCIAPRTLRVQKTSVPLSPDTNLFLLTSVRQHQHARFSYQIKRAPIIFCIEYTFSAFFFFSSIYECSPIRNYSIQMISSTQSIYLSSPEEPAHSNKPFFSLNRINKTIFIICFLLLVN